MQGFFDIMDQVIADTLEVDVDKYIEIIETKCSEEEATTIIMTLLESEDKPEEIAKAKEIFNKYV
jgi:hypothetical protein